MDDAGGTGPLLRVLLSNQSVFREANAGSLVFDILLILLFILINAFFAAAEMAIVTQNDNKIRKLAEEGNHAASKLILFIEDKSRLLATIQVLITLAGFLSSAFAADKLASRLYRVADPGFNHLWLQSFFVVVVTILLSYISLVLGELVPKRLAMRKPEQFSLAVVGVLRVFDKILRPFTKLLEMSCNAVLRMLGIDPKETVSSATEEEIRILAEAGVGTGDIGADDALLIDNIFAFDDKDAAEIMTPRLSIAAICADAGYEETYATVANASYSRFPVYEDDLDDIVGVLFVKDLMRVPRAKQGEAFDLRDIMRKAYFVPESKRIDVLFKEMKENHLSLVIVIDEYGGTEGLITIEDLLEEIVGDIEDEYDPPKNDVIINSDGSFILNGLLTPAEAGRYVPPLDELEEDDDYDTIAGFVLSLLGRIPEPGEHPSVVYDNLKFTVLEMDDRRIARIRLDIIEPSAEDDDLKNGRKSENDEE